MIYAIADLLAQMACVKSHCIFLKPGKACYHVIIQHKLLMILPASSCLVPPLHQKKKAKTKQKKPEKEGVDSQVLLFEEERNFWGLENNFCTGLSARLCSRPATCPWAGGLTPWGCYFSMCNVGHLRLRCAFGITGMLGAQPYRICFSRSKTAKQLHPAPPSPSPGRLDSLYSPKGVLFSPLPASTCAVCVLEHVSPFSTPFPHPKSPSALVVVWEESAILLLLPLLAGCKALISISIAGFLLRLPHRPGRRTRNPLFADGMFSQP